MVIRRYFTFIDENTLYDKTFPYPFGLSQLERRRKWIMDEIHELNNQIERSKHDLKTMSWL
jgi:hypothetical protein